MKKSEYTILHGGLSKKQKQENVNKFLNNDCILVSNIRVGGTGFNFQKCNNILIFSEQWSFISKNQAQARIVRPQQEKECICHSLIAIGTIEERIYKRLKEKVKFSDFIKSEIETIKKTGSQTRL